MFKMYVKMYYDFAISSVYFNDTEMPGFNAAFLVKKNIDNESGIESGNWDAIHIVECNLNEQGKASYAVTSTVMASLIINTQTIGKMELTGNTSTGAQEIV